MRQWLIRVNRLLDQNMPLLTPGGVILGFLFPSLFILFRPAIPVLFGCMTLSGVLGLRGRELVFVFRNPLPIILFFIVAHGCMPLLSFVVGKLWNTSEVAYTAGLVLLFSVPTAVSGFIWNGIYRGDGALALSLIVLDTVLAPVVVPTTLRLLMGTSLTVDMTGLALSLVAMVVLPTIVGVVLNETSKGRVPCMVGPYLNPFAKLCLLVVIAANSAAIAPALDLRDSALVTIAIQVLALGFAGFFLGFLSGGLRGIEDQQRRTLVFSVGLRNISAAATLAIGFFPEKAALPAIMGIVFQQSTASVAGRLLLGIPPMEDPMYPSKR